MHCQTSENTESYPQAETKKPLRLPRLPRPGRPDQERRQARSAHAAHALSLALNGAATKSGLDAVVITDDFGMMVSSSDTELDLGMLAAVTPIIARGGAIARIRRGGERRDLSVQTVHILGETLHIAALGGERAQRQRSAAAIAAAATRILS